MNTLTDGEVLAVSGGETVPLDQVGDKDSDAYQMGHALGEAALRAWTYITIIFK